jgi:hypothetical protein
MPFSVQPLQFLLTLFAGWISRRQLEAIEYLREEGRLLKERLGPHATPPPIACFQLRECRSRCNAVV